MKPIKMFGLAALAALMAMAFVGASSAMAEETALCDVDPGAGSPQACPTKHLISHVHGTSLGKAKMLSTFLDVECTVLYLGDVLSLLSRPLVIHSTFTYTACNNFCSVTEENGPGEILVLKTGHETANVTGESLVHVICFGFINCRYNGVGFLGTAKGPLLSSAIAPKGEISIQEQAVEWESGTLCPEETKLDIVTTPLVTTYITN